MIKKLEAWLRNIIADELRKFKEEDVKGLIVEVKDDPSHWVAPLDTVDADHTLRKVK